MNNDEISYVTYTSFIVIKTRSVRP